MQIMVRTYRLKQAEKYCLFGTLSFLALACITYYAVEKSLLFDTIPFVLYVINAIAFSVMAHYAKIIYTYKELRHLKYCDIPNMSLCKLTHQQQYLIDARFTIVPSKRTTLNMLEVRCPFCDHLLYTCNPKSCKE